MRDLKLNVKEIKGSCPVCKVGDVFHIRDGYKLEACQPICMHALASILPYYVALSHGISPVELGLGEDTARVQCLDPCDYTGGGTVIFEISGEEEHE